MGKHQTVPNHIIFEIKDSQQTFGGGRVEKSDAFQGLAAGKEGRESRKSCGLSRSYSSVP